MTERSRGHRDGHGGHPSTYAWRVTYRERDPKRLLADADGPTKVKTVTATSEASARLKVCLHVGCLVGDIVEVTRAI